MIAAIYSRKSTEQSGVADEAKSVSRQIEHAKAYCASKGWRVADELLPLEWHQIDRAAGVIRLEPNTTKNDHGRTFKDGEIDELVAAVDGLWARHEALAAQAS